LHRQQYLGAALAAHRCENFLLEAAMSVLAPKPIQKADANPSFERLLDSEEAASFLKIHPGVRIRMLAI